MIEECSCGSRFEYVRVGGITVTDGRLERVYEMMKDWRENHRHEFPPVEATPEDPPTIVESGSSHERIADEFPAQERALIGFTRNGVR